MIHKIRKNNLEYSVLLPIYCKEQPEYFNRSIRSMLEQTIEPDEVVIMEDGPLTPELEKIVTDYEKKNDNVRVIRNEEHIGLGRILAQGVLECKYKYIARMDSDDISEPDRIEKEWKIFESHPEISMVGCIYDEFQTEGEEGPIRKLPETPRQIMDFAHRRNPFGHSSLLIDKNAIIEAGNYRDYPGVEDYDLWIRMLMNGTQCYNIQTPLVHVRAGRDFYNRRGGAKYLSHLINFFNEYRIKGFFSMTDYIYTVSVRTVVCLLPGNVRDSIYKTFLRTKESKKGKITPIVTAANIMEEPVPFEFEKAKSLM